MSKTKTFISVISFQGKRRQEDGTEKDALESVLYKPSGNAKLEYGETRFPIIPVINGYANDKDPIRVIAILTDGDNSNAKNSKHNYDVYFKREIEGIVKSKSLLLSEIEIIHTLDSEDIDTQLKLFSDIADTIKSEEDVYACITYGTKPMPIVLSMALNYAYKLKKDVSVVCTVYGRFSHKVDGKNVGYIYDTTSLFYMDSIVNKLAEIKAKDPAKAIKLMLGLESVGGE